jgi:hypothetical protein
VCTFETFNRGFRNHGPEQVTMPFGAELLTVGICPGQFVKPITYLLRVPHTSEDAMARQAGARLFCPVRRAEVWQARKQRSTPLRWRRQEEQWLGPDSSTTSA